MLFVGIVAGLSLTAAVCVMQAIRVEKKWDDENGSF